MIDWRKTQINSEPIPASRLELKRMMTAKPKMHDGELLDKPKRRRNKKGAVDTCVPMVAGQSAASEEVKAFERDYRINAYNDEFLARTKRNV